MYILNSRRLALYCIHLQQRPSTRRGQCADELYKLLRAILHAYQPMNCKNDTFTCIALLLRRLCPCSLCKPLSLFQTERTTRNHLKKHGYAHRQHLNSYGHLEDRSLPDEHGLGTISPELEHLSFSADDSHPVPDADYPSSPAEASSPLLHFPSSDDGDTGFDQRNSPPPSSSPPLYSLFSGDNNPALNDDNSSDLSLSLTFDMASGYCAAGNDETRSDTTDELPEDEDEDVWIPEHDPQYLPNDALFDDTLVNSDEPRNVIPPALSEHRALLSGYVHVFANAACRHVTHADSEETLNLLYSTIKSCHPNVQPPSAAGDDASADVASAESVPAALKTKCDSAKGSG
ncbi:hypothetical protein EV424DRAFT_1441932 [Suillus variegatus]|nr:hypothetical protein EV424DRAFT_1441932 [Suillus variegatus]